MKHTRINLYEILLLFLLGFLCTSMARDYMYATWPSSKEALAAHTEMVHLQGQVPSQYRLLSFFVPDALYHSGFSLVQAYTWTHFFVITLAFYFFANALRVLFAQEPVYLPLLTTSLLALIYVFGQEPVIQPADSWALLSVSMLLWAGLLKKYRILSLMCVFLISSLSKEVAYFYFPFVLYSIYDYSGKKWKKTLISAMFIFVPALVSSFLIRYYIPAKGALRKEFLSTFLINLSIVRDLPWLLARDDFFLSRSRSGNIHWLFVFATALPPLLVWKIRKMPKFYFWAMGTLLFPLSLNLLFGFVTEFRIFVDMFIFLIPIIIKFHLNYDPKNHASLQEIIAKLAFLPLLTSVLYIISLFLGTNGFYHTEEGRYFRFRWMDRKASFVYDLRRAPGKELFLPVKISGYQLDPGEFKLLSVRYQQGTKLRQQELKVSNEWIFYRLPVDDFQNAPVTIALETDFYFSPAALRGNSQDRRLLSVQIGEILTKKEAEIVEKSRIESP